MLCFLVTSVLRFALLPYYRHVIPSLLFNGTLVTDFQEKVRIFNSLLANQCTLVSNNIFLPSKITYMTEERIYLIIFNKLNVIKIIRVLNVNKAHGRDNISVRIVKLCNNAVAYPLTLMIFQISVASGCWYLLY